MANTAYRNGVPLLNKTKASGASLDTRVTKFNNVNFTYSEFTIDTTLGTPSPTVYYNTYYSNSITDIVQIAWGDGSFEVKKGNTGSGLNDDYTYASNGAYTVRFLPIVNLVSPFGLRNQTGQEALFGIKLTDITHWGWSTGLTPHWFSGGNCNSPNMTQPSATDPAPAGSAQVINARSAIVDRGISTWGTAYKSVALSAGQNNNQNYNEVWTGVTPDFSVGTAGGNVFNRCGNFNQNVDSWAPETRQCLNWNNFFLRAFAFNNGDPAGVSGGSIGTGWDTFNMSATYASGTTTGVTTNKLVDSTASFVTDEVAVGMKVHLRYGGVFTTVSSVDSETELTLADNLFTNIGDGYSVTRSNIPTLVNMMSSINSFNQVITSWDVSGHITFENCLGGGFNQDIRPWDITQALNCSQFPGASFNFGFASGVANTYAQSWNNRVQQVQNWFRSFLSAFNSDITGWTFGYPNNMPGGTNTTDSELKLIDSTATFQTDGVTNLWRVTNMDTGKQANVVSVDSETQLTLDTDIFVGSTGQNYEVFYKVSVSDSNFGSITYPINTLDTRCIYNMNNLFGNGTTAITADLGDWNMRNNQSLASWFSASGGDKSSMVFPMRNWERGAIGDADYSTTRCNTSLNRLMYHAEPANNIPMDNLDTRNVLYYSTWNQNGRWYNTPSNFSMASALNLGNAWYNSPENFRARSWKNWWQHPTGCAFGTSASNVFPQGADGNAVQISRTESTIATGTTTALGTDNLKVIDSTATFITDGVEVADKVINVTTGKFAFVYSVDSETEITTSMDYFGTIGDSYQVISGYDGQLAYQGFLKCSAPTYFNIQATGTTDGTGTSRLIDSTASFLTTVAPGDVANNTTDSTSATVIRVVSNTELSISANRFVSGENYSIERFTPNAVLASGTTTSTTSFKLVDSGATFLSDVRQGDVVENTTDGTFTYVDTIDSDTQLTLQNDIFVSGEGYSIEGGYGWVITNSDFYQATGRTNTSSPSNATMVDDDATFTTSVQVGWECRNYNTNQIGTIISIDSDTQITTDNALLGGANDNYAIDQPGIL
jgi:hypothetical protein